MTRALAQTGEGAREHAYNHGSSFRVCGEGHSLWSVASCWRWAVSVTIAMAREPLRDASPPGMSMIGNIALHACGDNKTHRMGRWSRAVQGGNLWECSHLCLALVVAIN